MNNYTEFMEQVENDFKKWQIYIQKYQQGLKHVN